MDNSQTLNSTWPHPTGNKPAHVIMLMLGASKASYADGLATHHDRLFHRSAEVWTCNAGLRIWRHDLVFIMDDLEGEAHKWPEYGDDIEMHDCPIITSEVYDRFIGCHRYPFDFVCGQLGLRGINRYFRNSLPYMLAYAAAIGVEKITLFGADFTHPQQARREEDRPNAEWWLGFLTARGVAIEIPENSTLMGVNDRRPSYGYRFDPCITQDRARLAVMDEAEEEADKPMADIDEADIARARHALRDPPPPLRGLLEPCGPPKRTRVGPDWI